MESDNGISASNSKPDRKLKVEVKNGALKVEVKNGVRAIFENQSDISLVAVQGFEPRTLRI